jgi:hypothetical protein
MLWAVRAEVRAESREQRAFLLSPLRLFFSFRDLTWRALANHLLLRRLLHSVLQYVNSVIICIEVWRLLDFLWRVYCCHIPFGDSHRNIAFEEDSSERFCNWLMILPIALFWSRSSSLSLLDSRFAIRGSLAKWSRGKVSWFATSEHYIHRLHIFYRSMVGSLSKTRLDQAVAADQHWSLSSFLISTLREGRLSYRLTERRQQPAEFTYASHSLELRIQVLYSTGSQKMNVSTFERICSRLFCLFK